MGKALPTQCRRLSRSTPKPCYALGYERERRPRPHALVLGGPGAGSPFLHAASR
ncbi:hypothetical protein DB31_4474 [Hyalangium minutum]|uniref:Uncharacterized protein n=1 Tax=Hyalangium minutum TaxID=394096 RepID=A0A085W026_9BACT|nr:hypothetical protein DB31_4474 [Hyalangium minutum]